MNPAHQPARSLARLARSHPGELAADMVLGGYWWVRGPIVRGAQLVRERMRPRTKGQGRGDVLLLNGVWEPPGFLTNLHRHLRNQGWQVHTIEGLGLHLQDVEDIARTAAHYLEKRQLHDVVAVAHSKGGLVAKALLCEPEGRRRLDGAVTICTPFAGSSWAALLPAFMGVGSIAPGSACLRSLAGDTAANARITSIGAATDPMVPEGSHLDGARNIELPIHGHYLPLAHPRALRIIGDEVARMHRGPA